MALNVTYIEAKDNMATKNWVADRDLFLNADKSEAVELGDPDAAFLLARKGRMVKGAVVVQYKLKNKSKAKPKAEPKTEKKAVKKVADKAVKKGANK